MPANVVATANMKKHLTNEEKAKRAEAEASTLPTRKKLRLKMPTYLKADKVAEKYWKQTLKRMDGVDILDDLDSEILGIYCAMLSRRDKLSEMFLSCLKNPVEKNDNGGDGDAESVCDKSSCSCGSDQPCVGCEDCTCKENDKATLGEDVPSEKADIKNNANTILDDGSFEEAELDTLELLAKLDTKLISIEKSILSYAEKLGLTPSSRARLARARAESEENEPDFDLFG